MEQETHGKTPETNQNQDQKQTQDRKLLRPKTRETTDQMVTTMNNQDVHDEILLRRKTGALSRLSGLQRSTTTLQGTPSHSVIRAELLAPATRHLLQTDTQYTKPSPTPRGKRQKQEHTNRHIKSPK